MTGQTGRKNHGRGHSYLLDGAKVPGVTTIIGNGLPKPALMKWGIRTVANCAVDRWDELADMRPSERLKTLESSPYADRDAAAKRGTEVHGLAERLTRGEEIVVPEELAGHVEACVKFLDDWEPEPLVVERPVFNRKHKYGGTLDLIARLNDGLVWLLDNKTNRSGPFGDTAFQLAAYRYAEFYLDDNGEERPMPQIDRVGVVWLRADGYDLVPFEAGPQQHREFLYIAQVAQAAERSRDYKGPALEVPA